MSWLAASGLALVAIAAACGSSSGTLTNDGTGDDDAGGSFGSGDDGSGGSGGFASGSSSGGASSGSGVATTCDPSCAAAGGKCSGTTCTLGENPGAVAAATQTKLKAGGSADSAFKWLYPYDATVFPRGLVSPTLQFAGGAADAAFVHITGIGVDYTGFFKGGAQGAVRFALTQKAWDAVLAASGKSPLQIAVTKISGANVAGPISESWTIAQGSLRGTIYYETYDSALVAGSPALASAAGIGIMQIKPGAAKPTILKTGCGNVCHTASADGSTLVASTGLFQTTSSASYDLKNAAATLNSQSNNLFTYGGLYPDGSFLMSATDFRVSTNASSRLYDTKSGAAIGAPGWDGVVTRGGTTAFSPDGKQIAFVHEDKDQGHTLAKMDFAAKTKAFSNLTDLATDPAGYVGWPAFTPDGKQVIYHSGSNASFETDQGAKGDLFVVDVATKTVHRLDAAGGYTGSGSGTYLPANDPQMTFSPTVLPEATGGYFWAVFTSHRSYGNLAESMAPGGTDQDGKLWVSAIDIGATPGKDVSHPAFFLDGQELSADNLRGFWVLPPCQPTGKTCSTGDECCSGFCRAAGSTDLVCVTPPAGCSKDSEKCTAASDCCDTSEQCLGGYCSHSSPK